MISYSAYQCGVPPLWALAIGDRDYWRAAAAVAANVGLGVGEMTSADPSVLTRPNFDMARSWRGPPIGMLSARTVRPVPGCGRPCAVSGTESAAAIGAAS